MKTDLIVAGKMKKKSSKLQFVFFPIIWKRWLKIPRKRLSVFALREESYVI